MGNFLCQNFDPDVWIVSLDHFVAESANSDFYLFIYFPYGSETGLIVLVLWTTKIAVCKAFPTTFFRDFMSILFSSILILINF